MIDPDLEAAEADEKARWDQLQQTAQIPIAGSDLPISPQSEGAIAPVPRTRNDPMQVLPILGIGGTQSSTIVVQTSATKWQVSEGALFGSYDITDVISLANLATDLTLNPGDDALYLEVSYNTSTYPAVVSATFKANGSYGLPAGGNCIYTNLGTGGATNNCPLTLRAVLAKATVDANGNNVIRQCLFGSMWIQQNFVSKAQLSAGGTPAGVYFGIILGGGPG